MPRIWRSLIFTDKQDFEDARRGFMAPLPENGVIHTKEGNPVWDLSGFSFIKVEENAPDTVNPSLWRQSQLLMQTGLFQVMERVYQVRGADASNVSFIEGETGIIVVDPLTSVECARMALNLFYQHRPRKPVKAVIYTPQPCGSFWRRERSRVRRGGEAGRQGQNHRAGRVHEGSIG